MGVLEGSLIPASAISDRGMIDVFDELRRAIDSERDEQHQRLERLLERNATLERRVEALMAALVRHASTQEHPIPALTFDMASAAGLDPAHASAEEVLNAVCGVRLMDANRAALALFGVETANALMENAGEIFRAALVDPLARYVRAAARGERTFVRPVTLRDAAGRALRAELRANVSDLGKPDAARVTFAVVESAGEGQAARSAPKGEAGAPRGTNGRAVTLALSDLTQRLGPARRAPDPVSGGARCVGVVETRPAGAQGLCALLRSMGAALRFAAEPLAPGALEGCDVVLVDVAEGGPLDLDIAQLLHEAGVRAPLIAVTTNASASGRRRLAMAGFDSVIPKPLDMASIAYEVDRWRARGGADSEIIAVDAPPSPAAAAA